MRSFLTAFRALCLIGLFASTVAASEPTPTAAARARFHAGVSHLYAKEYDAAYREFKAAYAATPTWKILGNLGITADHLERDGEAIDALQTYLEEGARELGTREASEVRADLERLRAGLATVTLETTGPVWVIDTRLTGDGSVVNQYGPLEGRVELRVRAGQHEFRIDHGTAEGKASDVATWSVTLLAGDTASHCFAVAPKDGVVEAFDGASEASIPEPAPRMDSAISRKSPTVAYVLWGVAGLAAGATTVMFFESRRMQNEADANFTRSCPNGADRIQPRCADALADDAVAANLRTATLLTGIGAASAFIAGTVLYWLDMSSSNPSAPGQAERESAAIRPWVALTSLGVSGTF